MRVDLDLHLFERIDVEEKLRGAVAGVVGDVRAVQNVGVLTWIDAVPAKRDLVAGLGPADVDRAGGHAWRLRDHRPCVARVGHGLHQVLRKRETDIGRSGLDDRRCARDGDRLGEATHSEGRIKRERRRRLNSDIAVSLRAESGELECHAVNANRKGGYPKRSRIPRDG